MKADDWSAYQCLPWRVDFASVVALAFLAPDGITRSPADAKRPPIKPVVALMLVLVEPTKVETGEGFWSQIYYANVSVNNNRVGT